MRTSSATRERSSPFAATGDTGSASVLLHDLLAGPVRPATVVATGRSATYLDVDGRFLAVVVAGGVRLPNAVVLASGAILPEETELWVGEGAIGVGAIGDGAGAVVRVNRWFDPCVRLGPLGPGEADLLAVDPGAVSRLVACLVDRPGADPLLPTDSSGRLAVALALGGVESVVADLLGQGTGLTPAGDDLLAGALAALRAWASPAADGLVAAVAQHAQGQTTRLSMALLEAADQAAVIPQAAAVLRALVAGADPHGLVPAVENLLAVGHTSGWHLAAGLAVGAAHVLAGALSQGPPDRRSSATSEVAMPSGALRTAEGVAE